MSKKRLSVLIAILSTLFIIIVLKYSPYSLLVNRQLPETSPNIQDISDKFVITPNEEYSLSNKDIIIPASTSFSSPTIPERVGLKIKVYNSFSEPIWVKGKDCNYNGVLEKKTITGWAIASEEACQEEMKSIPGRFFNNGFNRLYHVIFTKNAKGDYRIKMNLLVGCKEAKDAGGNHTYENCEGEAISYSPIFKIID
jgi:hypothetical protein